MCADPSNLPFSDEKKEGFENKIAEMIGAALGLKVDYTWFPQVIGFARNTLHAYRCDLVMGTVAGDDVMQTTNPYYFTTYMMVYRSDKGLAFDGLAGSAAGELAARRGQRDPAVRPSRAAQPDGAHQAVPLDHRYPLESPTHQMVQDIVDGTIDVGFLWGPIAGYYRKHDGLPLTLVPLKEEPGAARMKYHIAMGVRANEPEWRRRINAASVEAAGGDHRDTSRLRGAASSTSRASSSARDGVSRLGWDLPILVLVILVGLLPVCAWRRPHRRASSPDCGGRTARKAGRPVAKIS